RNVNNSLSTSCDRFSGTFREVVAMRRRPLLCRFALLAAVLAVPCRPARAADFDEAKLAMIRPRLQRFVDDNQIAGAVTVVGTSRGIVSLEAVGNLRLDPKEPMTGAPLFP